MDDCLADNGNGRDDGFKATAEAARGDFGGWLIADELIGGSGKTRRHLEWCREDALIIELKCRGVLAVVNMGWAAENVSYGDLDGIL